MRYTEDTLAQQTMAEYLGGPLAWESVYAYNDETFGSAGLLGRASDCEVVLTRYLRAALEKLNPDLPPAAYNDALRQLTETSAAQSLVATNRDKYLLQLDGVLVSFHNAEGELERRRLRVFDFEHPANNHFLCVRELWVRGDLYRRRADIVGFVNGLPLVFVELKNVHKDLRVAYEKNLADYRDTIPQLFHHNALIVLGNGIAAKLGSLTSRFEHFHEWKRLAEDDAGVVDMETLLKGVFSKRNLMDLFENFIVFDDSTGRTVKIVARNHQFLGVNRALDAVRERHARGGKLGVFWHTQGSGKSYSMVFFTRKVHRKLGGNFTFLICTDREDLDRQIYKTFAGCGVVDNDRDRCRARDGDDLRDLLGQNKSHIFTLIQKFNLRVDPTQAYTNRDDLIVISDEAHRTQYGNLALNMRNALPHASYIGFTGTPLFKDDEITRRVFGDYVSTYDFQRAVDDGATVPLYYDARGDKLGISTHDLNERLAAKLEEIQVEDVDAQQRLERELKRDYHILTAHKRLDQVARDFVEHYSTAWETGKAMLVCIDKLTCVRVYNLIQKYWQERIRTLERGLDRTKDEQEEIYLRRQIEWMRETQMAVVVSEEQGEVDKFRKHKLDITPHRRLMKEGMEIPSELADRPEFRGFVHESGRRRLDIDLAFKEDAHPFRIAIVCAMWMTGFDVPSLGTLYLDKPLKAHTLMQAIARANRVHEGKTNGLIVDYCGILRNLRQALATFAGTGDRARGEDTPTDPTRPAQELLDGLGEAIALVRDFLTARSASLDAIMQGRGFGRNAAIQAAKEAANDNDESRKRFEVMCRALFSKFKACLTLTGINRYRAEVDAIQIVYKSLQDDTARADISDIIRELHQELDTAIETQKPPVAERLDKPYDISRIDFERLRQEFARSHAQCTVTQNLKQVVELRLEKLLAQNPLRTEYQQRYEEIISAYNREKDRATVEATFEALLKFVQGLGEEETRAFREGLDQESLAIFDLLNKPDLSAADIKRIKRVAIELLAALKREKLRVDHWRDKEATRDAVQTAIHNYLWNDQTGLPAPAYDENEVNARTAAVYAHIYRAYPTLPSPYYPAAG